VLGLGAAAARASRLRTAGRVASSTQLARYTRAQPARARKGASRGGVGLCSDEHLVRDAARPVSTG
jgi:hypothetical protein